MVTQNKEPKRFDPFLRSPLSDLTDGFIGGMLKAFALFAFALAIIAVVVASFTSCRTTYVPVTSTADTRTATIQAADNAQAERQALNDHVRRLIEQREGAEPEAAKAYTVHIDRLSRAGAALADAAEKLRSCSSKLERAESETVACASALALSGQRISKLESEAPGFFSKLKEKWDIGSAAFVAGFVVHILWVWAGGIKGIAALALRVFGKGAGF